MPGRNFNGDAYRYGFNGKENDNDVKNITGSQQDYGFRIYDTRLGRFLSVDPISRSYPMLTPYQFASNTPIQAIDLDGLEATTPLQGGSYRPPSDQVQRALDPAAVNYLSGKTGGNHGGTSTITNAATSLFGPAVEGINTFISGYNEDGSKAGVIDYAKSGIDIVLFGAMFGGEKVPANSTKVGVTNASKVIQETNLNVGKGDITSKFKLTETEALEAGEKFVGKNAIEKGRPGSGVYRSKVANSDGTFNQFRIDDNSITGKHSPYKNSNKNDPHVHFERVIEGKSNPDVNNHVPLKK